MPRKRLGAVRRIVKLIMASPAGSSAACIRVSHAAPYFGKGPTLRSGPNTYLSKEGCYAHRVWRPRQRIRSLPTSDRDVGSVRNDLASFTTCFTVTPSQH